MDEVSRQGESTGPTTNRLVGDHARAGVRTAKVRISSIDIEAASLASTQTLRFGGVTVLWGANDAGKSTTLRALGELFKADAEKGLLAICVEVEDETAHELAARSIEGALGSESRFQVQLDGEALMVEALDERLLDAAHAALDDDPLSAWIALCLVSAGVDRRRAEPLASTAAKARTIILLPSQEAGADNGWTPWWAESRGVDEPARPLVPAALEPALLSLPLAVSAPLSWSYVERVLAEACSSLGTYAVNSIEERDESPHVDALTGSARVLDALTRRAQERMPDFVAARYTLSAQSGEGAACTLRAIRRADGLHFPVAALAQGFHLWVQLAVVTLVDAAQRVLAAATVVDEELRPDLFSRVVALFDLLAGNEWGEDAADSFATEVEHVARAAGEAAAGPASDPLDQLGALNVPLFIIDEPEAHLHPAAQREAARWLSAQSGLHPGLFALASHSQAFLALADGAGLTHVSRDASHLVRLRSLDPRQLRALDPEIAELGFDRGELLALHRMVLFVEGATDQAVLEGLFRDELREMGVLVQPFHGIKTHRRITEADTLFRVLGPPFHVLVDNVPATRLDELKLANDATLDQQARKGVSDEEKFAAAVLLQARHHTHEVHVHSIECKDILALLDDESVGAVAQEWRPGVAPWPGFDVIIDRAGASKQNYNKLLQKFGVEKDPDFFSAVATLMRDQGRRPKALADVVGALAASARL